VSFYLSNRSGADRRLALCEFLLDLCSILRIPCVDEVCSFEKRFSNRSKHIRIGNLDRSTAAASPRPSIGRSIVNVDAGQRPVVVDRPCVNLNSGSVTQLGIEPIEAGCEGNLLLVVLLGAHVRCSVDRSGSGSRCLFRDSVHADHAFGISFL